ncbi:Alpha/Beta hydrolase fold [Venturia nashicola]|uniref:Alpha/Beta hydrolase fold n=1 Tax=Venturia nashicola TaxID=86259 RepID=A0A4Z1PC65_9PEZI|nr:Alpha/Beta hydrolase fold [Venturia nashicola]TLD35595.1 Alpha/Beta hydrolase fold [Venturia nashicola]
MGLPEPTLSFTIPSIHDDTVINARIYHPADPTSDGFGIEEHGRRGAIVAHPYAPLGGSYDDPVVGLVANQILKEGFVVCTFNFRGAHGSSGRTSWTGVKEREDYTAVAAFMIQYLHHSSTHNFSEQSLLPSDHAIQLVLGGFSYGSLITSHLPDSQEIVKSLVEAEDGKAMAEIKSRAGSLAVQVVHELKATRISFEANRSRSMSIANAKTHGHTLSVGGEETSPEKRRHSREGRLSSDLRRSIDLPRKIASLRRKNHHKHESTAVASNSEPPPLHVESSYLLISPLRPPVSSLATLPFGFRSLRHNHEELSKRLSLHHSLAVFGSDDIFTSAHKLRKWAKSISEVQNSVFRYVEIEHAGHFWRDPGVQKALKSAISEWIKSWSRRDAALTTIQSIDVRAIGEG